VNEQTAIYGWCKRHAETPVRAGRPFREASQSGVCRQITAVLTDCAECRAHTEGASADLWWFVPPGEAREELERCEDAGAAMAWYAERQAAHAG
jgi:hypothetical protein